MAYVTIPKDLSKVQSKVLFGLTKRQVICFGAAALVGVPLFFLTKGALGTTTAALCMILVMLPFFLFAMYALEVLVAFLQAYVFTILSAVYIGLATSDH